MLAFPYKLKRTSKRRATTSIRITPENGVEVSAPHWVSLSIIEEFLEKKRDWILKHLEKAQAKQVSKKTYQDGETHLYFGEAFPLKVTKAFVTKPKLSLLYDRFEALIPKHIEENKIANILKDHFTKWYLRQGKKVITQKVQYFTKKLNVSYNRITLKRVSSIWGSCSRKNNLNFNRKLIMAPHKIVDYVVIHEVCHLVHRHHRKSFWQLVASLDPSYKEHVKWLKDNSHILTL